MKYGLLFLFPLLSLAAEPLDVCEVLKHLNHYEGRTVEMRGILVWDGADQWLKPEKRCRAQQPGFLVHIADAPREKATGVFSGGIGGWEAPRRRGHKVPVFRITSMSELIRTKR